MAKRRIEVFTSGCFLCDEVVKLVQELACTNCDVTIYNLAEGCESDVCIEKARKYGVHAVPAVAVDGKLVECCRRGKVNRESLVAAGIGR